MSPHHAFSRRIVAALFMATLGLTTPAFASGDGDESSENHDSGHDDRDQHRESGNDDHGKKHDSKNEDHGRNGDSENHGGSPDSADDGSGKHGSSTSIRARLTGSAEPAARGEAKLKVKSRGTQFEVETKIPFPSAALAIVDRAAARDAGLTLRLSRAGVIYAECDFDLHGLKGRASRGTMKHKIEIYNRGGVIQTRSGICDIDPATAGVQSGLPAVQPGDLAEVVIDSNDATALEGAF